MKRVLITFAGGRLANSVCMALKAAPEPIHLIGVDSAPFHIHQAMTDEAHLVPLARDPNYISILSDVARESKADYIWPMHDAEVGRISEAASELPARTWVPPASVTATCWNKMATFRVFKAAGVPAPESVLIDTHEDLDRAFETLNGEVWLRANSGTAGTGALRTSNREQATGWLDLHDGWGKFMAAEVLPGNTDFSWEAIYKAGELIASQAKTRLVRGASGISIAGVFGRAVIRHDAPPEVHEVAASAVHAVMPVPDGIFRVDLLADKNGIPAVTEVDAGRFGSSGMGFWHEYGFNFPYQALRIGFGEPVDFKTPVIDPFPKDIVAIGGVNRELIFVKLSDVETKQAEYQNRLARMGIDAR